MAHDLLTEDSRDILVSAAGTSQTVGAFFERASAAFTVINILATASVDTANFTDVSGSSANFTASVSAGSMWVGGYEVVGRGQKAHGQLYLSATAATTISAASTSHAFTGSFSARSTFVDVSASKADGRLEYTGTNATRLRVDAHISVWASSANKRMGLVIAKNSSARSESTMARFASNTNRQSMSTVLLVSANPNDFFSPRIINFTDTTNFATGRLILTVTEL